MGFVFWLTCFLKVVVVVVVVVVVLAAVGAAKEDQLDSDVLA